MNDTLTLNQQFVYAKYKLYAKEASREQLEELFLEILLQKLKQETAFNQLFTIL